MDLLKMNTVGGLDFSDWGFSIPLTLNSKTDIISTLCNEVFDCLEFAPFISDKRERPLDFTVTMPMTDSIYELDNPHLSIDAAKVIEDEVSFCLEIATEDGIEGEGHTEFLGKLEETRDELERLLAITKCAITKAKGVK